MAADDTLTGILTFTDANNDPIDVTDLLQGAPLLRVLPAKKSSHGTTHKYMKEITAPGVGFRDVNTGITNAAGEEEQVSVGLKFLDASVRRDIAKAKAYPKGQEAYMMWQGEKSLKTALANCENQIINGTGNSSDGFNGLADSVFVDDVGDGMVVDAEGSGGKTVYVIRASEDDVCVVYNDENIMMSEIYRTRAVDGSDDPYTELAMDIDAWLGLQVGSQYSVARIHNLDGTSDNKLTDDLIAAAISLFPTDRPPTHIVLSRASLLELQQSRTATNPTGAPAPMPETSHKLPIVVTDQIAASNTLDTTTTT
jgi:hypothetical protein